MIRSLLAAAALLGGLVGLTGTAAADPPVKFDTFASSVNLCNGDTVELAGVFSVQQNFKPNGDVTFHQTFHGQGTGEPSGAEYVLTFNDHVTFSPGETTESFRAHLISKGGEPNFVSVIVQKNGTFSFTQECTG